MSTTTHGNEKIAEALKLLNEAAAEKKTELAGLISDKYESLKEVVIESEHSAAQAIALAKRRAMEAATHAKEFTVQKAKVVDEHVHSNPWQYIGGAAVVGVLLGYILGRNNNR